jgi:hypothetical protein
MKLVITRWKALPLKCRGLPALPTPFSPAQQPSGKIRGVDEEKADPKKPALKHETSYEKTIQQIGREIQRKYEMNPTVQIRRFTTNKV